MNQVRGQFEEQLRSSMENFELPYEPSGWKDMEKRMSKSSGGNSSWIVALAAACVLSGVGVWSLYQTNFRKFDAKLGNTQPRFQTIIQNSGVSANVDQTNAPENGGSQLSGLVNSSESISNSTSTNTGVNNSSIDGSNSSISSNNTNDAVAADQVGTTSNTVVTSTQTESTSSNTHNVTGPHKNNALGVMASVSNTCAGTEIDFNAGSGPNDGSYLWNFGDGNFSSQQKPKHKYDKPGVYDVSLSITSKKDGQIKTNIMEDFITINPAPDADFEWQFVNGSMEEPTVKIINTSENANSFAWKFDDGSASGEISPLKAYTSKAKHMVYLEVANAHGCKDSKVKYIPVNTDYNLMAQDKISVGKEVFMPEALKQGKQTFRLTVYNGKEAIFESSSKNKGWDGKLPDGSMAAAGQQYPWIVIITNASTNEEKYFSGLLNIVP